MRQVTIKSDYLAAATKFFDEFVDAFTSFDGNKIAERYHVPFVAVHSDGSVETMQSVTEIAAYFQRFLDQYHTDGCRSCTYDNLDVIPVGDACLLATVTWLLQDEDMDTVTSWRESYNLLCANNTMLVLSSVDHAD